MKHFCVDRSSSQNRGVFCLFLLPPLSFSCSLTKTPGEVFFLSSLLSTGTASILEYALNVRYNSLGPIAASMLMCHSFLPTQPMQHRQERVAQRSKHEQQLNYTLLALSSSLRYAWNRESVYIPLLSAVDTSLAEKD